MILVFFPGVIGGLWCSIAIVGQEYMLALGIHRLSVPILKGAAVGAMTMAERGSIVAMVLRDGPVLASLGPAVSLGLDRAGNPSLVRTLICME